MRILALLVIAAFGVVVAGLPASGSRADLLRATTDRPDDISGPQIHIVYAIPSDGTDRSLDTNGAIVASVNAWNGWLASQTDGKGGFRLDTSGGALDVTFFVDPHTNADIAARGAFVREQLESDLHAAGFNSVGKIYAVYYDGTSTYSCGGGAWPPAIVGNVAAIYMHGLPDGPIPCDRNTLTPNGAPGYYDFSMVHEIMHTLGFVPTCAPHQTLRGHVSDAQNDLMWAGEGNWRLPPTLDVGHDDYFETGHAGCLDLVNSAYLTSNAPAAQPTASVPSVASGTTTKATTTTTTPLNSGIAKERSCASPRGPGDSQAHSRNLRVVAISCSVGRKVALGCTKYTYGHSGTCTVAGFRWRCTSTRAGALESPQRCVAGVHRRIGIIWLD